MAVKKKQNGPPASTGGSLTGSLTGSLISDAKLQQLYATMLQCRLLSERARRLRTGNKAMFAACAGHEALATGCALDLRLADTVSLAPQDATATLQIARLANGRPLSELVHDLFTSRAPAAGTSEKQIDAAISIAKANKKKKNNRVVVVFTHADAVAMPHGRKALLSAGKAILPIIFVVENNRVAKPPAKHVEPQAVSLKKQAPPSRITVDGSDVVAVYRVAHETLARVRRGDGPVVIEGIAFRLSNESRSKHHDPLLHMEQYLKTRKLWSARWKQQLVQNFSLEFDVAIKAAKQGPAAG